MEPPGVTFSISALWKQYLQNSDPCVMFILSIICVLYAVPTIPHLDPSSHFLCAEALNVPLKNWYSHITPQSEYTYKHYKIKLLYDFKLFLLGTIATYAIARRKARIELVI
jgi:hypothetical protein